MVIPWDDATVGGFALTRMLDEPARRRLAARIRRAVAARALSRSPPRRAASIEAIAGRSRRLATLFRRARRSAGARTRTAALPVRLGPAGIVEVVLPSLSVVEQVALDNAMML